MSASSCSSILRYKWRDREINNRLCKSCQLVFTVLAIVLRHLYRKNPKIFMDDLCMRADDNYEYVVTACIKVGMQTESYIQAQ